MTEEQDVRQKVSPEVMARVEGGAEDEAGIPVIVTLAPGADPSALERNGMRIRNVWENIPAVAGTVAGADVTRLADIGEVKRVEYDGEMSAY